MRFARYGRVVAVLVIRQRQRRLLHHVGRRLRIVRRRLPAAAAATRVAGARGTPVRRTAAAAAVPPSPAATATAVPPPAAAAATVPRPAATVPPPAATVPPRAAAPPATVPPRAAESPATVPPPERAASAGRAPRAPRGARALRVPLRRERPAHGRREEPARDEDRRRGDRLLFAGGTGRHRAHGQVHGGRSQRVQRRGGPEEAGLWPAQRLQLTSDDDLKEYVLSDGITTPRPAHPAVHCACVARENNIIRRLRLHCYLFACDLFSSV